MPAEQVGDESIEYFLPITKRLNRKDELREKGEPEDQESKIYCQVSGDAPNIHSVIQVLWSREKIQNNDQNWWKYQIKPGPMVEADVTHIFEFYNKTPQCAKRITRYNRLMPSVEFHCHTDVSRDSLTRPAELVAAARRKGIDRVVVTDHNTIAGALMARALDPERVIVGEEIMTTRGEILAAFVSEEIPAGLSPQETIRRLREQGAFISVSHPFDRWRSGGWRKEDLLEILPLVDAIEVYNSRCMLPQFNRQARRFAEEHNIPGTVGSDAHAAFELGRSVLLLEQFEGAEGMRRVIRGGIPQTRWSPPWTRLASRYASLFKALMES